MTTKIKLGSVAYNPRAIHNKRSWEILSAALAKDPVAQADLVKALSMTPAQVTKAAKDHEWRAAPVKERNGKKVESVSGFRKDHADFIGYLVKGKHLVIAK